MFRLKTIVLLTFLFSGCQTPFGSEKGLRHLSNIADQDSSKSASSHQIDGEIVSESFSDTPRVADAEIKDPKSIDEAVFTRLTDKKVAGNFTGAGSFQPLKMPPSKAISVGFADQSPSSGGSHLLLPSHSAVAEAKQLPAAGTVLKDEVVSREAISCSFRDRGFSSGANQVSLPRQIAIAKAKKIPAEATVLTDDATHVNYSAGSSTRETTADFQDSGTPHFNDLESSNVNFSDSSSANEGTTDFQDSTRLHFNDFESSVASSRPSSLERESYKNMSISEAVRLGLQNSKVIRDLGGTILQNPEAIASAYDPSITHSNPFFGEEAALSEFDANLNASSVFENNDLEVNNQFLGDNGSIQQDLGNLQLGVTKRTATGALVSLRSVSDYDNNNSVGNRFGTPSSSWQTFLEGEMRQPLLRGGRVNVNRITTPGAATGEFNGIEIAKSRTDISVSEFKISVRNLVSDIENAYWDLYFAYRDLEARKAARDNALQSWRRIQSLGNEKKEGGEADKEGQAREQYFRFEAAVQDAIFGRPGDGTSSNNGTSAGIFRPASGLKVAERRFRYLVGLPLSSSDTMTIRPTNEPSVVPTSYDLDVCVNTAFANRSELKRQLEIIRQTELQMQAARDLLLPQLDLVGRYRVRGFGSDLVGQSSIPNDSASADLFDAEHQEWQLGMELNVAVGYRREFATIRNIEQRLLREKQVLHEQKRRIAADIGNALDNVERAYLFHVLQYNRLAGALDQLHAVRITNEQKKAPLNLVLEAQRRVLDAQTDLYRAKVEFALAKRDVEFEQGTLLTNMNVQFSDRENLLDSNFYEPAEHHSSQNFEVIDFGHVVNARAGSGTYDTFSDY